MTHISNTNEINKIVRKCLISQSELDPILVLSALELHGTTLDQYIEEDDDIWDSFQTSQSVILFELVSRNLSADVSYTEDDYSIVYDKAFTVKCIVYGDRSLDTALKTVARFRTDYVRQNLYDEGVYLEKISDISTLNEFKNETMWLRNDFDIDIGCEIAYQQTESVPDIETANITIKLLGE